MGDAASQAGVAGPRIAASRIVVIMPNWLGDGVMATPFLRALRGMYGGAKIAAVARPLVAPVLSGLGSVDEVFVAKKGEEAAGLKWMREGRFDLGILLPNSFRSAWMMWRGGVKRRLGYAREWRSLLLTDRVRPVMRSAEQREGDRKRSVVAKAAVGSKYQPVPTIGYYLELAKYLGISDAWKQMELGVTEGERAEAVATLVQMGIDVAGERDEKVIVLVPGANFGSSKCWPPERFAMLADRLMDRQGDFGAQVVIASSPAEMGIVEAILGASALCPGGGGIGKLHALAKVNGGKGVSLGALKEIVRRSAMMICNDTGPRHFGAAFGVPTVTLFGPTDPVWAMTYAEKERIVRVEVGCSPCQLKKCPIDHRCMRGLEVEMVLEAARELWPTPVDPREAEFEAEMKREGRG